MSQDHEEKCSMQTQVGKPTKEQRIEVLFDVKGQPLGKEGDELQSWIGVLTLEHIPIWISDFRSADLAPRKEIVWMEVVTSFTIEELFKKQVLKSCGESAKGFRYDLYQAFVKDHIDEENAWQRPSKFEKTRKYVDRHERWLDTRVKPDGQFKKEAFKSIADTIDDFSQQETQGSFESVGIEDILTKALGNVEHSGRIRGQSKFVKQSQYFNLVQPTRKNVEVSDMKRQLAALEKTVQELCAKHGINRETMVEEANTPTVDQHSSFKASCTINEKEAGSSDPKPMPNASKECQLFIPDLVNGGDVLVAIGREYMDCVPTDIVHGIPLGEENVRVTITVPKLNRALLPIPMNEATSIEEAVEAEGSKRTKKRVGKKKIQSQPEVEQQPAQQELHSFDFNDISFELRPLAYYAQSSMRDVIDPWDDSVMYFNPLGNEPGDDFKDLITTALNDWKVLVGSGIRQRCNWQTLIDTVRCPIHEGYVECGYFVLAYMREITFTVDGLAVLQTKDFYTDAYMSLVRHEWATFVMRFIQY
ncbi:hypothetical protein TIFTF001_016594 [Ficus carica]|uniref:Ubiquitin-like protease family profile domain-containing protein n=1 Tax=Ficus carica TaxID=3494 RepID=A0AA88A3F1_FICCA|nr:hypothetical protein TIFTF001_016594 [Ficus carica]